MRATSTRLGMAVLLAGLALLPAACGDREDGVRPGSAMPDFGLMDVNPNSPTLAQSISPRGFKNRVSAWYFGHST